MNNGGEYGQKEKKISYIETKVEGRKGKTKRKIFLKG